MSGIICVLCTVMPFFCCWVWGCSFGLAPNRGFLVDLRQKSVGHINIYKETGVV